MREDLVTAVRSLRKSPTFTLVALVVLALGIGAATGLFSIVDAVVLRGLPFDEHDRLVAVLEFDTRRPTTFGGGSTTPQMFLDWRTKQESFDAITAIASTSYRLRSETGEPADARASRVTWEFFPVLRIAPILGRTFTSADEVQGQHRVVILSYGFWQRRFGGATDVVGKKIDFNEEPWEVVGVMGPGFSYPIASDRPSDVFTPIAFTDEEKVRGGSRNYNFLTVARLKSGVSIAQAHDQMNRLMTALNEQYPKWTTNNAQVITLHHHLVKRVRAWMLLLLGAVGVLLVIACANVANLMLARATARGREIGIRAALGAGRWRLIRALLVEGVVLSLAGALVGLALAYAGVQLVKFWLPTGLPRVADIGIDLRVLATATLAGIATGLLFGVVPALHASRPDLTTSLKDTGRSATASSVSLRLRSTLVVAEMALAVVLLVGAGLFAGSFLRLIRVDPGFDYRNILTFSVSLRLPTGVRFGMPEYDQWRTRNREYTSQVLSALHAVPGVQSVAAVSGGLPLTGSWSRTRVSLPGMGELQGDDDSTDIRTVTPGYLELLRIPLKRGRLLAASDNAQSEWVTVINEAAAKKDWPGNDPIGQPIKINDRERRVVGIVGDIRHLGPETPARQEMYVTYAQGNNDGATVVLKTTTDPLSVLAAAKQVVWRINSEQRFTADTVTLEGFMDRLIAQRRFNMAMLVLFGVLGLVITAAGIYGVMAYIVEQRTSEIGLRMALGATPGGVVTMVLRRAALLMLLGLIVGGVAAWSLRTTVQTFLFEMRAGDPAMFGVAIGILTMAGLLASGVPALRAARVDPLVALRQE